MQMVMSHNIDFQVPMKKACTREIQEFCASVPHGDGRTIRCLQDNKYQKEFSKVSTDRLALMYAQPMCVCACVWACVCACVCVCAISPTKPNHTKHTLLTEHSTRLHITLANIAHSKHTTYTSRSARQRCKSMRRTLPLTTD